MKLNWPPHLRQGVGVGVGVGAGKKTDAVCKKLN